MEETNLDSNAQNWELEVTCRNKKYLDAVVKAILVYGMIDFEVENIEYKAYQDRYEGRYLVHMSCSWFNNLKNISRDLAKIEKKLENE
jgi:hypothetical protein